MHRIALALLLFPRPVRAQPLGQPLSFGRSSSGRVAYLAEPPVQTGSKRLAWAMTTGPGGRPEMQAYAFLLERVAFSLSSSPDRWPTVCDELFLNWNEVAHRFEPFTTASGIVSGTPRCTFRGTIYFKGFLTPRIDIRPEVAVTIEGAQGSVPVPVSVLLDERRSTDWSGIPVFLGEISTTMLADGPQHLRVNGGYREYRIDGNPATPEFEDGGDANTAFIVANHPPRLTELVVRAGGATLYDGAWSRERRITTDVLSLTRTGGTIERTAERRKSEASVLLRFSLPVAQVAVELRSKDGSWFALPPPQPDEEGDTASGWRATLPLEPLTRGTWTFRVSAHDSDGNPLEHLRGEEIPLARLGNLNPDTGACVAGGQPCDLGVDTVHRLTVTVPGKGDR